MRGSGQSRRGRAQAKRPQSKILEQVNLYAAGIDVGSTSHFAAVPEELDTQPVREFAAFTGHLNRLADRLGLSPGNHISGGKRYEVSYLEEAEWILLSTEKGSGLWLFEAPENHRYPTESKCFGSRFSDTDLGVLRLADFWLLLQATSPTQ